MNYPAIRWLSLQGLPGVTMIVVPLKLKFHNFPDLQLIETELGRRLGDHLYLLCSSYTFHYKTNRALPGYLLFLCSVHTHLSILRCADK